MKAIGLSSRISRMNLPVAHRVAILAALALICTSCGSPAPVDNSHNRNIKTLKVAVIEAGGPALPDGSTPRHHVANAEVKVTGVNTSLSSRTGRTGIATFRLPSGSYLISSPTCGSTGTKKVTIASAGSTSLTWWCAIG